MCVKCRIVRFDGSGLTDECPKLTKCDYFRDCTNCEFNKMVDGYEVICTSPEQEGGEL